MAKMSKLKEIFFRLNDNLCGAMHILDKPINIDYLKNLAIQRAKDRIHSDICGKNCVSECLELTKFI